MKVSYLLLGFSFILFIASLYFLVNFLKNIPYWTKIYNLSENKYPFIKKPPPKFIIPCVIFLIILCTSLFFLVWYLLPKEIAYLIVVLQSLIAYLIADYGIKKRIIFDFLKRRYLKKIDDPATLEEMRQFLEKIKK